MKKQKDSSYKPQHIARTLAVQALYAYTIEDHNKTLQWQADKILKSYKKRELIDDFNQADTNKLDFPDEDFFHKLISEFSSNKLNQEELIKRFLEGKWTIEKLDILLKVILMLATFELQYFGDIPVKVIIDEYVSITKLFYEKSEIGFVNGILDAIGKELRNEEFEVQLKSQKDN